MSTVQIVLLWAAIAMGALVALVILSFIVYLIWTRIYGSEPEGVMMELDGPARIDAGEPFTISVTLHNHLDRSRPVHSVDIEHTLLKGFSIDRIEPSPHDTSSMLGSTAYHYERLNISKNDRLLVTLHCKAGVPGEYEGEIMAYVDNKSMKSLTQRTRLHVGFSEVHHPPTLSP